VRLARSPGSQRSVLVRRNLWWSVSFRDEQSQRWGISDVKVVTGHISKAKPGQADHNSIKTLKEQSSHAMYKRHDNTAFGDLDLGVSSNETPFTQ
jgi:hypothetical protein